MARYDSTKPYFLKIDWSSRAMSFILMQPDDSVASTTALQLLRSTGENKFDSTLDGPRLQPIDAGCRLCTEAESHHHNCIEEIGAGRWGSSKNKVYLFGELFYWMCDMKSIGIILEYLGPIHALRRWSQELMAYDFLPVYRPDFTMRDVDALNRGPYHKVVNSYNAMTYTLHEQDTKECPSAYSASVLKTLMESGKYMLKGRSVAAPVRASEMDIAITLVDCCHLISNDASRACSTATSCTSSPSIIDRNKSSLDSMANDTKSENNCIESCCKSSMANMVNSTKSDNDCIESYCKSSMASMVNYNKSDNDCIESCSKSSMASMVNFSHSSGASMCYESSLSSTMNDLPNRNC